VHPAQPKPKPQKERPRKLTFKEERELEMLPEQIAALEEEQESLHKKLADPELYKSAGAGVPAMNSRLEAIETELETLLARWEELECFKG